VVPDRRVGGGKSGNFYFFSHRVKDPWGAFRFVPYEHSAFSRFSFSHSGGSFWELDAATVAPGFGGGGVRVCRAEAAAHAGFGGVCVGAGVGRLAVVAVE
jgi:hypothetical protein